MKIAILTDLHVGVKNGSDIFLDYFAKFYREVFFPYCDEHGIKEILMLGDYYDNRKTTRIRALHHNRKSFLEPLMERGMHMTVIPGNHDTFYKSTNEICSLKEHLGHFMNNIHIQMKPGVQMYDNIAIALIPWINQENYSEVLSFINKTTAPILGAHLELNGFEMMKGMKSSDGMDHAIFDKFDFVWTGHYHTKSSKDNIHYLGTPYEMTWADANDPKYFHIFDTDKPSQLEMVRNPLTIFHKIFYNDSEVSDYSKYDVSEMNDKFIKIFVVCRKNQKMFDRFIDKIQNNCTYHDLKIIESYVEFRGDNNNNTNITALTDTTDLIKQYVESISTDLNTDVLIQKLMELHTEAQNNND